MHDIRLIRDNPEAFDAAMARRGLGPVAGRILDIDNERKLAEQLHQTQLAERNKLAKAIGAAKASGNIAEYDRLRESAELRKSIGDASGETAAKHATKVFDLLTSQPNRPADDVPDGADEAGNVELKRWGHKRQFNYAPANHADMGPALGLDFEAGAKLSGARFSVLRGQMAHLQRALGQLMLDIHTGTNGYSETVVPLLVKDNIMLGTGQLPKFQADQFLAGDVRGRSDLFWKALPSDFEDRIAEAGKGNFKSALDEMLEEAKTVEQFWLIPTAEVALTNLVRDSIETESDLPIKLTALTPCFRSEAGAAGKDTRGYIRQHQFEKVELVTICRPDDSAAEHETMTLAAEAILEALDLPYRRMLLCAGDMGFSARKTYDLEVWLPGQDAYREISSISDCGDFQARRMNAQYRPEGQSKGPWPFVHTLNGSGLAVGRTLVAVLENYQQEDGSVEVPEALLPYMGGVTKLTPTP